MRLIDLTGRRFGSFVVEARAERTPRGDTRWQCRCDCGKVCLVTRGNLKRGQPSCGCRRGLDLLGKRMGRLVTLGPAPFRVRGNIAWKCLCDCGASLVVTAHGLSSGETRSCGCLQREVAKDQIWEANRERREFSASEAGRAARRDYSRRYQAQARRQLADNYVKFVLEVTGMQLPRAALTPEMVELKRLSLFLRRQAPVLKQAINERMET